MNSKKRKTTRPMRNRLATALMSVFILALFALPAFSGLVWAKGILFDNRDPRKVVNIEPMQVRAIDQSGQLKPFNEPIVSITFDDGWETTYSKALPLLQKEGLPTTQYIIGGVFDNHSYMSVAQVQSMQKAGHEIGSHTMTHPDLTQLTDASLSWELVQSKTVLTEKFGPIKDFASPLGAANDRTIAAVKQNYRSQRNTEGDPNTVANKGVNLGSEFNIYSITGYTVRKTTTMQDLKDMLQFTATYSGWVVLTYHQVDDSGETYSITPETLAKQLKLISDSHIRVATVGQVLDAYTAGGK
ncbi:MAG TPA: polysaccharide deacetylase family protein [Nevskiaceae bacterium]|nr:polysaccharide deacetylase family protein [Nevskiaceae bacterium]